MKSLLKATVRILAAAAICAAVSACSQPGYTSAGNMSFPTYSSQAAVTGGFSAPSIMDY